MVQPINAPYAQTYTQHSPYISNDEYMTSATSTSVADLTGIGGPAAVTKSLQNVIVQASGWADQICHQVLAATTEVEAQYYRVQADGSLLVPVRFDPIVQVTGFACGQNAAAQILATDLTGVAIPNPKVVLIPPTLVGSSWTYDRRVWAETFYVAGYANGYLTAAVTAGATALPIDSALGVVPGMSLNILDPMTLASETVVVASVTGQTITLTAGTQYAHAVGVNVGALPPVIKQAVCLLTTAAIKRRGATSFNIQSAIQAPTVDQSFPAGGRETAEAMKMLNDFARVV